MKNRIFITLSLGFFAVLSGTGWALTQTGYGNPSIRSPIGPPTVPQSSYRSGLFPSINPIDTSGNQVITGNVGGGKHFRGFVPYNAISDFSGTTTSTTFNSFLRRSASSGSLGIPAGRYSPYYSPSGTVTTTRPGLSSVVRPPTSQIPNQAAEGFTVPSIPQQQSLAGPKVSAPDISYRPMRFKPQHLEKLILDGTLTYAQAKRLVDEQNVAQMERLKQDMGQLRQHRAPSLKQSLIVRDESLRPFSKLEQDAGTLQPPTLLKTQEQEKQQETLRDKLFSIGKDKLNNLQTQEQTDEAGTKDVSGLDVYEQMKQDIESIQAKYLIPDARDSKETSGIEGEEPTGDTSQEKTPLEKLRLKKLASLTEEEIEALEVELEKEMTSVKPQEQLSGLALSIRAQSIRGEHKTFASYANDKFNEHMRTAEQYLKEGKYYRASDTYTLASIYKSKDPLAYAGKSHALFAAGGYMSSALFLSRTLEIFPEYARFKIDLVAMVGDRDKVESRIADINEWLQISDSGELQFLLGYVYYQLGRIGEAKKSIDAAFEKLLDAPAVKTLKKAIDSTGTGK